MRHVHHFLAVLLLLALAPLAHSQQAVNCSPGVACSTAGPSNTETGDPLFLAYGKINQNTNQLFGMFPGTTGIAKLNGAVPNALTIASAADIVAAFSGCTGSQYLGADGACHTASGSGSVTSVALVMPSGCSVAGTPITTSGTFTVTCTLAQSAGGTGASSLAAALIPTFGTGIAVNDCLKALSVNPLVITTAGAACGSGGGSSNINPGVTGNIAYYAANGSTLSALGTSGSGNVTLVTSPTLVTPTLGAALATTINGDTLTAGSWTLNGSPGKTLNFNNTITLGGTDSTTFTFPGASGTVATLNSTQTFTAVKTFTNSDLALLGSSSGSTTFASANASATNFTATFPANTGTVAETNVSQTWSGVQIFGTSISIGGTIPTGATGSGLLVFGTSPTLITPNIGAATATSVNGTAVPASTTLATVTGSVVNTHCAQFSGTGGALADSGASCGSGGSGGGARTQFAGVSTATTLSPTNTAVVVDASAATVAITLPSGTSDTNTYCITKKDATTNAVTMVSTGGATFEGQASPASLTTIGGVCWNSDTSGNWWY